MGNEGTLSQFAVTLLPSIPVRLSLRRGVLESGSPSPLGEGVGGVACLSREGGLAWMFY